MNPPIRIACARCLAANRVPAERTTDDPVCGRCGERLLDGLPAVLDDRTFDTIAANTDLPVVVDFWAAWCGPCRAMAPQFDQAAHLLKGRALLVKVDSDANPALSRRFAIRSIPTLIRLDHGAETARRSGAIASAQIVQFSTAAAR